MNTHKNMKKWRKDKKRRHHASHYSAVKLDGNN